MRLALFRAIVAGITVALALSPLFLLLVVGASLARVGPPLSLLQIAGMLAAPSFTTFTLGFATAAPVLATEALAVRWPPSARRDRLLACLAGIATSAAIAIACLECIYSACAIRSVIVFRGSARASMSEFARIVLEIADDHAFLRSFALGLGLAAISFGSCLYARLQRSTLYDRTKLIFAVSSCAGLAAFMALTERQNNGPAVLFFFASYSGLLLHLHLLLGLKVSTRLERRIDAWREEPR
jgi:hypothetical protein